MLKMLKDILKVTQVLAPLQFQRPRTQLVLIVPILVQSHS